MPVMSGGQALARSLAEEGVKVIFGVPGAGQYEAIDGIYEEPRIRYIATRHEQTTSYMADGYARISGEPACILVIRGPGMYNSMSGITGAYSQGSPMVVISGGGHANRPVQDELAFVRGITKWASRTEGATDVPSVVNEAFRQIGMGRPGPVYLEVPHSVLVEEVDVDLREPVQISATELSLKSIERGAIALAGAERPAILVNGRVGREVGEDLLRLAVHLQSPVLTSVDGKGAISDRHPLSLGMLNSKYRPMREWIDRRDALLVLGKVSGMTEFLKGKIVVSVDIEESGGDDGADDAVRIVAPLPTALKALYRGIAGVIEARESHFEELDAIRADRLGKDEQLEPQASFMRAIRSVVPDNGVLVQGMTQLGYYSRNYYPVYEPNTYLVAARNTLGHAFPMALGAKLAAPDRAVVALSGDGGFLYNSQELATAVQYGINVVAIVFNDNAYGNVLRVQMEEFKGHVLGTQLHNPDFVALANTYGARGIRVDGAGELEAALKAAIDADELTVIEVPVGAMKRRY